MNKIVKYFSGKELKNVASGYGYQFSNKRYYLSFIMMMVLSVGIGFLYGMKIQYIASFFLVGAACVPALMNHNYRANYQRRRFRDVDIYLHQMGYSFMRNPKINASLEDVSDITDGDIKKTVDKAIDELRYGYSNNAYEAALSIISERYGCARMTTLHKFLIDVETRGGKYKSSLRVIMDDFDMWVGSIYRFDKEISRIKKDTTFGIVISMVLAGITVIMSNVLAGFSGNGINIKNDMVYQIGTFLFVSACFIFYTFMQISYDRDYLHNDRSYEQMEKDYKLVFQSDVKKSYFLMIPPQIILIVVTAILFYFKVYLIAIYMLIVIFVLSLYPYIYRKSLKKKLADDIHICFSEWLRKVALNLENKPLLAAIEDTYSDCPSIMKNSLGEFIKNMEADPSDIKPYYEFLSEFKQMDISATVRTLYSISELDENSRDETINSLIARNNELINAQDKVEFINKTSALRFMEYIPVLFASIKMGVDMMLIVSLYL
ncbi:MAG: hypothetical protein Q4F06_03455 [Eubacteriales bacterium]|nr:hypothetical protein [Eubacteriales bacterium]